MTVPPAGKAPAGGDFSLPALSAPKSRLGHVWVTFGSNGKAAKLSIGKSSENAKNSVET